MLSVIIPAYNEGENINFAADTIGEILKDIEHEILFCDDGSKDDTWDIICRRAESDPRIRGLSFSRNFGKEGAVFAGLEKARGDCGVVIDCDLQHPPELICTSCGNRAMKWLRRERRVAGGKAWFIKCLLNHFIN
jgi:dolichol-phosphate mannosyltransferase